MFRSMQGISIRQKDFLEGGERDVSHLSLFLYATFCIIFLSLSRV